MSVKLFINRFSETVESSTCKGKIPIEPLIPKPNNPIIKMVKPVDIKTLSCFAIFLGEEYFFMYNCILLFDDD